MRSNFSRGYAFLVLSCFFYVLLGTVKKTLALSLPPWEVVFLRYLVGLFIFVPYWFITGRPSLKTNCLSVYFARAIFGCAAFYLAICSYKNLQFSSVILLRQTVPLFLPLLGIIILKERVSKKCLASIFVGFLGVIIFVRPGAEIFNWFSFVAILSAFCIACAVTFIRKAAKKEPQTNVIFYLNVIPLIISAPFFLLGGVKWPGVSGIFWLFCLGVIGIIAQVALVKAYKYSSPTKLAPFGYMSVIFSVMFDWLIWMQIPTFWFWLGAVFITVGGILTIRSRDVNYAMG